MNIRKRNQGFTMVEISIVLLIVGIIAAIAIPSYQDSVRKGRRAAAQACLTELSQFMERYYAQQLTYSGASVPAANRMQCINELNSFYTFALAAAPTQSAYTLRAAPVGGSAQAGDKCGTMTLNQTGAKTPTTPADCWR